MWEHKAVKDFILSKRNTTEFTKAEIKVWFEKTTPLKELK